MAAPKTPISRISTNRIIHAKIRKISNGKTDYRKILVIIIAKIVIQQIRRKTGLAYHTESHAHIPCRPHTPVRPLAVHQEAVKSGDRKRFPAAEQNMEISRINAKI